MASRAGLASSAAWMFSGTLVSRVLGLVRNALMVAAIGVTGSGAADAFSVANKLPNVIYMLLAGGILNAVLVPQIVKAMRQKDGGAAYVNRLLTLAAVVMGAVTIVLTLAAGILVSIYAADFRSGPWAPLAIAFAMWCVPQLFFYGMYTLFGQILNARSNFGPYMWAPALNNVISILGLVAYLIVYGSYTIGDVPAGSWDGRRIALFAAPWTLGVVMQALILLIPLYRSGFRYKPTWGLRGSGLGTAGKVAGWAFAALVAGQIGYLAVSNIAASAGTAAATGGPGGVPDPSIAGNAAYDNAFFIFMLPQSLITVSLVTALFTRLSQHAVSKRTDHVRDDLSRGLRTLSVFTIFAAGAFMVLAIPLTQVIQFDQATFPSYRAIGHVLVAMLIGLPAIAVWTMVQRVYFAFEDTRFLFYVQVAMAVVQILGSFSAFFLVDVHYWVVGAGLATTGSNIVGGLVAFLALRRKLPNLDGARIFRTHLRVTLAALVPVLIGWGLLHLWGVQTNFVGALLRVVVLGLLMAAGYYVLLRRLRVNELEQLTSRVAAMAGPIVSRLEPITSRVSIPARLRTIWARIIGTDMGNGGLLVGQADELSVASGDTVADRYVLRSQIETDLPHASRWLSSDEILQKDVVLTILHGENRLHTLDAARRAGLIHDPRLAPVRRVGNQQGMAFIVTDPLVARSLAELVAEGPMEPGQARSLIGEAAAALDSARKRGVHHLRLRPNALWLTNEAGALITGLAADAAQADISPGEAKHASRADTQDLVRLLYTALTGKWPGPAELAGTLPLAPVIDDAPVPPQELVEEVPTDLNALCQATLSDIGDGPFTPGELVRQLQPWDDLVAPAELGDTGNAGAGVGGAGAAGAGVGGAGAAGAGAAGMGDPALAEELIDTSQNPIASAGTSAAMLTTASAQSAGAQSGSTVIPTPGRGVPTSADSEGSGDSATSAGTATSAETASSKETAAAGGVGGAGGPGTAGGFAGAATPENSAEQAGAPSSPEADLGLFGGAGAGAAGATGPAGKPAPRERFNPTPWVILAMVAALVIGLILALTSLSNARTSFDPSAYAKPSPTEAAPTETAKPTPTPTPSPTEKKEEPKKEPITFDKASSLDPSTGVGDNADQADRAIDGDPDTMWKSLRYEDPKYGMKKGLGFAVTLDKPTEVSKVTLDVRGKGGEVQIRDTSADDPSGGKVLAEGEMGPNKTYEFDEPTKLSAIVLWFPELPQADSDGRNRIELAEISAE